MNMIKVPFEERLASIVTDIRLALSAEDKDISTLIWHLIDGTIMAFVSDRLEGNTDPTDEDMVIISDALIEHIASQVRRRLGSSKEKILKQ